MENEEFENIEIICTQCGEKFIHSARDQKFFKEMNFKNIPKYCISCRKERREIREKKEQRKNQTFDSQQAA